MTMEQVKLCQILIGNQISDSLDETVVNRDLTLRQTLST